MYNRYEVTLDFWTRCCATLAQCDEFASDDALRDVFVAGPLAAHRERVPQAQHVQARVQGCVAYLLTQGASGGRPLLAHLCVALAGGYAGTELGATLSVLAEEAGKLRLLVEAERGVAEKIVAQEGLLGEEADEEVQAVLQKLRARQVVLQGLVAADAFVVRGAGGAERVVVGALMATNSSVQVAGRDAIQQHYHIYGKPGGTPRLDAAGFTRVLQAYLDWVVREYGKVRLYGLDSVRTTGRPAAKELGEIFVPLTLRRVAHVREDEVHALTQKDVEADERRAYLALAEGRSGAGEVVAAEALLTQGARLAVVGGAGCGKSTLLAYFAAGLAAATRTAVALPFALPEEVPALVPVVVPLRYWREYTRLCAGASAAERLRDARIGTLAGFIPWYLRRLNPVLETSEDFFDRLLLGGGCLLMLDGLDEVVDARSRGRMREQIEKLIEVVYPGNRVLVTAREAGYRDDALFGDDFVRCDVQRLDEAQIGALVANWCRQLYPADAERRAAALSAEIAAINARRLAGDLPPLVSTPLMTAMVVSVKWGATELPRERARLYEACVQVILQGQYLPDDDERDSVVNMGGPWEQQRTWLSVLALAMHAGGQAGAAVPEARVRAVLAEVATPTEIDAFIAAVRLRGGLFEERGELFQFAHLTFQEFLAARWLAKRRVEGLKELEPRIADPWWREVLVLLYGYAREDWAPFAGEYLAWLAEYGLEGVELAGTALLEVEKPEAAVRGEYARKLCAVLTDRAVRAPGVVRGRAGVTLARLGDPREEVLTVAGMQFCWVPAGPFVMGSVVEEGAEGYDARARGGEAPQHKVTLPGYAIGRWPVTLAQYKEFVEAKGYEQQDYWAEAQAVGRWSKKGFMGDRDDAPRTMPAKYSGAFNESNHPVVGVSWYEALAFTCWLTQHAQAKGWLASGINVTLPSEEQWEKAARGGRMIPEAALRGGWNTMKGWGRARVMLERNPWPVRIYPWGNTFDVAHANVGDTGINATNAVGVFASGVSVYGVEELSGGVWEWTQSTFRAYPYKAEADRLAAFAVAANEAGSQWDVRGGSWQYDHRLARCAFRGKLRSGDFHTTVGFRVVCLGPISAG